MSAVDTFVAFVDSLSNHLDDHDASGSDLAARVHLSRFHFDRVVTAVAGETPARFRRRVLLERSAYRLVTSDLGVLDIAVEAGYGSHEAYTRAFHRAYGRPPASWRSSPGRIQLPTDSGVHFHPPGGLRLPARDKVTTMDFMIRMVEHHIWVVDAMIERAARLGDERLDAPVELSVEGVDDHPTVRSLLSRLVGQMAMWNASMDSRSYDWSLEDHESVASMRRRLAAEGATYLERIRDVAEGDRLDETFVDATCEPARVFTYGGMLAHVLTYAAHRRTLVAGALWSFGIRDLDDDPMLWMADAAPS